MAYGGSSVTLPMIMVDSGHQISYGYLDFHTVYQGMVDAALARPPQAEVSGTLLRDGSQVHASITVTNRSGVTLSAANSAAVHLIVYENNKVALTHRYVRAAVRMDIASLENNASATYALESAALSGVDWAKLHFIALADYRPGGTAGAYDTLQAAELVPPLYIPLIYRH